MTTIYTSIEEYIDGALARYHNKQAEAERAAGEEAQRKQQVRKQAEANAREVLRATLFEDSPVLADAFTVTPQLHNDADPGTFRVIRCSLPVGTARVDLDLVSNQSYSEWAAMPERPKWRADGKVKVYDSRNWAYFPTLWEAVGYARMRENEARKLEMQMAEEEARCAQAEQPRTVDAPPHEPSAEETMVMAIRQMLREEVHEYHNRDYDY